MTGKELILMVAGTAVVAGAGGVGAAVVAQKDAGPAQPDEAVLARLDAVAKSLEETNDVLTDNREAVRRLGTRMEAVEMGLGTPRAAARDNGRRRRRVLQSDTTDVDVDRLVETVQETDIGWEIGDTEEIQKSLDEVMQKLGKQLENIEVDASTPAIRLGGLRGVHGLDGEDGALAVHLGGLQKAMELRRLPEEERWARARDEVGLNSVQEDEIRAAVAERDEALEGALEIERSDDGEGGDITLKRMDFQKAREANKRYRERVGNTLNDSQKKAWDDGGYDQAFGNGSMGGTTVISVSGFSTRSSGAKDE